MRSLLHLKGAFFILCSGAALLDFPGDVIGLDTAWRRSEELSASAETTRVGIPPAAKEFNNDALRDFVLSFRSNSVRSTDNQLEDDNRMHNNAIEREVQLHGGDSVHSQKSPHLRETSDNKSISTKTILGHPPVTRPSHAVIDLSGKIAFVAGVADSSGFGWAIAKSLHQAGATVLVGTWAPMVLRFEKMIISGSLDEDRRYDTAEGPGNGMLNITKIYPLDVAFDDVTDIPEEVKTNRRFSPLLAAGRGFSISEVANQVAKDFGKVDILVHAIANGPEVSKPLLSTTRKGYLAAQASSAYSLVSLVQKFGPLMAGVPGGGGAGSVVSLTYIASDMVVPGYGGGMSSAKASLESDTRTLAYEAGREFGIRINSISAGPLKSRAANAIKKPRETKSFIDYAIAYNKANAPLTQDLLASDVAEAALFLLSPMSRAVTGTTLYVDNGMHTMGMASDSQSLKD